jgi:hypothetical protein
MIELLGRSVQLVLVLALISYKLALALRQAYVAYVVPLHMWTKMPITLPQSKGCSQDRQWLNVLTSTCPCAASVLWMSLDMRWGRSIF